MSDLRGKPALSRTDIPVRPLQEQTLSDRSQSRERKRPESAEESSVAHLDRLPSAARCERGLDRGEDRKAGAGIQDCLSVLVDCLREILCQSEIVLTRH